MRGIFKIARTILSLRHLTRNPSELKRIDFNSVFGHAKKLTKLERKYVLKAVLAYRKIFPYEVQDYSEAKKMYEDYFNLPNAIGSVEELQEKFDSDKELYIVKFREEAPVKGKRWCEYYVNHGYDDEQEGVYKVYSISKSASGRYKIIVDYNICVSEEDLTAFKYATQKEVKDFKRNEIREASINNSIKKKYKEIEELRKLIND